MHLCSSCNRRTKIQWWWWWWWFIPQKKSQSVLKIQQDALAGFENCFTAGRKEEGDKKRIKEGDLWRSLTSCAPTFQPGANNNNDNNVRLLQLQSERYNRTNIYPVKLSGFFRAAWNAGADWRWERCLSVKRVHCDKTAERYVQIFVPYERSLRLVFKKKNGWWVRSILPEIFHPATVGAKSPTFSRYSLVVPQLYHLAKNTLTLIGSPLWAFQWA